MKKMLAMILAIAMLLSIASVASASKSINLNVSCTSTTNYTRSSQQETKSASSEQGTIYVRHYDNVNTDEYTNHFRGQEVDSGWVTRGSKWCTQGMTVPIQNDNIRSPKTYSISARGNTNYYNYDGISSIWLSGTFYVNYPN